MLAAAIIVLVLGILLIKSLTAAKDPLEESSSAQSDSQAAHAISIPQIISSDSLTPEPSGPEVSSEQEPSVPDSVNTQNSSQESAATSSQEESVPEESSSEDGEWKTVTDDYFKDAAFIGNSLTEGLFFYTDIGELADGFYSTGLNVSSAQDEVFIEGGYTLHQKLTSKTYGKIYIMMGLNEIGWPDPDSFIEYYEVLIRQILRDCPGAIIYVQSILPVSAARSAEGDEITNENIRYFNRYIQDMVDRNGWVYLNVWEAIANPDGVLDADATPDGIHFGSNYMEKWIAYLKQHAVN